MSCSVVQNSLQAIQTGRPANLLESSTLSSIENWGQLTRVGSSLIIPFLRAADTQIGLDYEMRWREFANKIHIYNSVKRVERTLNLRSANGASLSELLSRAAAVDPFTRGWAFEGIGYYYASIRLSTDRGKSILKSNAAMNERPESATMLHAGMGMALAEVLLKRLRSRAITDIDRALDEFERQCEFHAADGYTGATLEPLGLMARTYYRDLLMPISIQLKQRADALAEYFWHGVGRARSFDTKIRVGSRLDFR